MKRVFEVLLFLFTCCSIYGQQTSKAKISIDKPGDEYRWVKTEYNIFNNDGYTALFVGLSADALYGNEQPTDFSLALKIHNSSCVNFDKNSMLLFKFEDGSLLELKCKNEITDVDCSLVGGSDNRFVSYPSYSITEKQLNDLITKKVLKIRLETTLMLYDVEIKDNKFSSVLQGQYDLVKSTLAVSRTKYSDF